MTSSITYERRQQTEATLSAIRALHQRDGINPASLSATAEILSALALRTDLFTFDEFPPPSDTSGPLSTRYALSEGEDQRYALYLQALLPGKTSVPHNHGTWAVIAAITGEELNRIYRRVDDGSIPDHARLELEREHTVRPGQPLVFQGEDIHSIHVQGEQPALHFHLYGQALETLTQRVAFDLETGEVRPYNKHYWRPSLQT